MENLTTSLACQSRLAYVMEEKIIGSEGAIEREISSAADSQERILLVLDGHGTPLANGDSVVVIKSLHVKGSPKPIKGGTKVKDIRLGEGVNNIHCEIEGFGSISLKSEFFKKA
jgi:protein PhnA